MRFPFRFTGILLSLLISGNIPAFAAVASQTLPAQPSAVTGTGLTPGIAGPGTGMADNTVGIVAAVQGGVEAASPGQSPRTLKSGMPVFLGDQVSTDAQGRLQLLLRDETAFTLGASSSITIDEFVFDPSTNSGKVGAKVGKGVFRFISGKIAKKDPKNMTVKLPVGTIGIRGTIVAGKTEGTKSRVYLLGPGENNNTGDRSGKIIVSNEIGNKTEKVNVTRPGFATTIEPGAPPTPPALAPLAEIQSLTNALQGNPNVQKSTDNANSSSQNQSSATQQANQDTFQALTDISNALKTTEITDTAENNSNEAAQDKADNVVEITDGISTLAQLLTVQTGQYHFETSGNVYNHGTSVYAGSYTYYMNVDFGARTFGGGHSRLEISTDGTNLYPFDEAVSFNNLTAGNGQATHTWNSEAADDPTMTVVVTASAVNSGGVVAANMDFSFVESSSGTPAHDGSGTAPRQSGSAPDPGPG